MLEARAGEAAAAARLLDELAFSQALQRHTKLLLVENEVEEILTPTVALTPTPTLTASPTL